MDVFFNCREIQPWAGSLSYIFCIVQCFLLILHCYAVEQPKQWIFWDQEYFCLMKSSLLHQSLTSRSSFLCETINFYGTMFCYFVISRYIKWFHHVSYKWLTGITHIAPNSLDFYREGWSSNQLTPKRVKGTNPTMKHEITKRAYIRYIVISVILPNLNSKYLVVNETLEHIFSVLLWVWIDSNTNKCHLNIQNISLISNIYTWLDLIL